jgi:hypothetical protein
VELVPYNLLGYSQDFSNAYWSTYQATIGSNVITAPDGTMTADSITNNLSAVASVYKTGNQNFGTNTISCYFKKGTYNYVFLELGGNAYNFCSFNLATGTTEVISGFSNVTIQSVGNGWYRCSATASDTAATITVGYGTAGSPTAGDVTYLWGAQLVEGSAVKDYQKTETRLNIPRLDYSNGTCPSLLVEPQRTNLLTYSSSFDNAVWVKDNNGSGTLPVITANYATAPDGTMSADRAQFSNIGGSGSASNYSMLIHFGLTLSSTGTATIYLKSNTSSNQEVLLYWAVGEGAVFTVTPEWQRFTLSNLSVGSTGLVLGTRGGSGSFFNGGDEVLDILVWGAQLEAGSYPTSYIPTTSASVTRNADVISKTGISSLIGQTEGSVFLDLDYTSNGTNYLLQLGDNTTNFIELYVAGGVLYFSGYNGSAQWSISTAVSTQHYKIAYAYKANDIVLYVNGTLIGTDTSAAIPTCSNLYLNQEFGGLYNQRQFYNASALWKTRLTNTQLAQLTTI